MPLNASNQAETPDLFLRNHISVRISHRSLKLPILRSRSGSCYCNSFRSQIFLMLVKSVKQWAQRVKSNINGLLRRGRRGGVNKIVQLILTIVVAECVWAAASSRRRQTWKPSKMVPSKRRRVFLFFGSFLYFLPATKRKEMNITNIF